MPAPLATDPRSPAAHTQRASRSGFASAAPQHAGGSARLHAPDPAGAPRRASFAALGRVKRGPAGVFSDHLGSTAVRLRNRSMWYDHSGKYTASTPLTRLALCPGYEH
jgi:hypothetical protein